MEDQTQGQDQQADQSQAEDIETLRAQAKAAEDFKRDMLRFKKDAQDKAALLEKVAQERAAEEKKRMVESQRYEELYKASEAEKSELAKAKEAAERTVQQYIVQRELTEKAVSSGIRKDALPDLRLLGIDDIEIEAAGGEIKVKGVTEWVDRLKKSRPHWFETAAPVKFKDGKPGAASGTPDLATLKKTDPEAYKEAFAAALKAAQL